MDIFSVITLAGGLAFFLYGMHVMSSGLEKIAGGSLEKTLKKMTANIWTSLILGASITIAIQSSSAMAVMLVGLVNSGIMTLSQTVGVIMGSNIGTTLTAWILSTTGIESSNKLIMLMKPESFAPVVAVVGIGLIMISKKKKKHDIGAILVGFAILMFGMNLMSDSVSPLREMPEFANMMTAFHNPLFGVLVGTLVTGVIQSSAASVGILQALSETGAISYGMAIPIIMGQNIGTCVTALISSIGVNKNAKRVAVVHIAFNVIGTAVCLTVFTILQAIFKIEAINSAISPLGVAAAHSIFNIVTTAIILPFNKLLVKLANVVIRDNKDESEKFTVVDERLLGTPSFAISECFNAAVKMADYAKSSAIKALGLYSKFDRTIAEKIVITEDKIDNLEDKLGSYLVKLASKDLSEQDSKRISNLLTAIGDFERIGDHALNILNGANEIEEKSIDFSSPAKAEIDILKSAIEEILSITMEAFEKNDIRLAKKVEPLEQVIDNLVSEAKRRHVERLTSGICTIEMGFILSDLLTNCERISDHCSNIAVAIIELDDNTLDVHEYLNEIKTSGAPEYESYFAEYNKKYKMK